jgi:hypothetical protein
MQIPEQPYYLVLHGAKKNVGDFLIRDRAKRILAHLRKDRALVELGRWESLDDKRDLLAGARAIIGMGGPALQENVYPGIYKLTQRLETIRCPIYLLGVGSSTFPPFPSFIENVAMTEAGRRFLQTCAGISTRDYLTSELLERQGVPKAEMSGCPAWYQVEHLGKPMVIPGEPQRILLSTPQRDVYAPQMVELALAVKRRFPKASLVAAFNRGFAPDEHASAREGSHLAALKDRLAELGFEIADLSYELSKLEAYADFDLHVGYRLHSHIFFLSMRKPSYLIAEDSRALGHCRTLQLPDFVGVRENLAFHLLPKRGLWQAKRAAVRLLRPYRRDDAVPARVLSTIQNDVDAGFASFLGVAQKLDRHFETMRRYVEAMP